MNHKKLLLASAVLAATGAMAQSVPTHEMYVDYAIPEDIVAALDAWQPGKNWGAGTNYEDENFFISRVPIKSRFLPGAYANQNLNDENDKNLCWCVPIGEMTKKWGPLPRYNFDGDNFNMWQYINIHSNWSNGWWRVPGAFNDVAHKNGVRTGCTYFIDWGTSVGPYEEPGKTLYNLCQKDDDGNFIYAHKLIEFLRYYGIDGLAINPEGRWGALLFKPFMAFLAECHKVAKEMNYPFHVDWYSFVTNAGQLSDNQCSLTNANDNWFHDKASNQPVTDVFFLNYNWSENSLKKSVETAKSYNRSTFDVYAGFDQQGRGYGKFNNAGWETLMKYPVSIVVWGAHDRSQLYASSSESGQSDYAVQNEYQKKQELLFSGGNRNVLDLPALNTGNTVASFSDLAKWHGYAKAVRERSTLSEVPFVTRFNLGNGRFMNNEGVTTWNHKWYNIGMQDLLPTWRWWIDNGDGKTVPEQAVQADFTFDDAWFGGSCLKLHGATSRSDMRLFATQWQVSGADDTFRLVYKPATEGETHLQLMVSKQGKENEFTYVALPATAKANEWNHAEVKASALGLKAGDVIGCAGLSVRNTNDHFSTLLGEFAFVPASFKETPQTPSITSTKVMKRLYNRADFKVIFSMPTPTSRKAEYAGCPVYNEEVGAWYYEVYVKQGAKETLVTTTTSWAAYVVDAPLEVNDPNFQIGIRAVGRDGKTKSPITWSKVIESPLTLIETLTLNRSIIKPNQKITVGFEDPNHPVAQFRILNALTGEVAASGNDLLQMECSLPEVGSYDVEVTTNGKTLMNRSFILVTPEETGSMPSINSITADKTTVKNGDLVNFTADVNDGTTFNGKPCTVSKSLYMKEPYQLTVDYKVMKEYTHNSYSLWFKVEKFEHASLGTLLMTKVNRNYNNTWTENVWGEMWTAIRPEGYAKNNNLKRNNKPNEISVCFDAPPAGTPNYEHNNDVDGLSDGYTLMPNVWYHVCVVKNGKNDIRVYLNGKCIIKCQARGANPKDWRGANFYVGGSMTNLASFTGWVDEVQIWSKALTEEEVLQSMKGYDEAPEGLEGYFTFEETMTDSKGYMYFPNKGRAERKVRGAYMTIGQDKNGQNFDNKQNQLTTALGVPYITGSSNIKLESSKWMIEGANLVESDLQSAQARYNKPGNHKVSLTVTNSWGSYTYEMDDYVVVGISDVKDNESGYMIYPKPFEGKANIFFAEDGDFRVNVYGTDGKLVAGQNVEARAGEIHEVQLGEGASGVYVVTIMKGNQCVRSFKINKK